MRPFFSFPALVAGLVLPGLAVAQDAPAGAQDPSAGVQSSTAGVQQNPARDRELRDAIPLTPDMIRELGRRYQENQGAREDVATPFSAPASRPAINVSFAPGQQTSLIETAKGYPTAISFFDNTGAPWPIGWDTNSNAANPGGGTNCSSSSSSGGSPSVQAVGFYVCVPVKGSNTIEITPMSVNPRGGLLVNLAGAPKPVSFMLIRGQASYDANLSVRVSDRGPNARLDIDTRPGAPMTGEPYMNGMLSGVAPSAAVPLVVEGNGVSPDEVRAWRLGKEVFLRTRYTLMSPAWDGSESGEGGMTIYALPNTPVVLLSVADRTVSATLREPE